LDKLSKGQRGADNRLSMARWFLEKFGSAPV